MSDAVSSVMSRNRWEEIKSHFHLVNNKNIGKTDELCKVRMLVGHLKQVQKGSHDRKSEYKRTNCSIQGDFKHEAVHS